MVLVAYVIVLALQTIPAQAFSVGGYSKIFEGVEYATATATSPRLMRAFALRISLQNPDVGTWNTSSNGGAPYETALQTTPAFLSQFGLKCAINTCYFDAGLSPNTNIQGLLVTGGNVVSTWEPARDAEVHLTINKIATIVNNGGTSGVWDGFSGDAWHLINGYLGGDPGANPEPRTSAGLSQDGKYLILVCVDGRQSGWSLGATLYDMSQWQRDFGAYNAINCDGGGSTTMSIAGMGSYVNRPCYGYARSVGANFGIQTTASNTQGPDACAMNANRMDIVTRGAGNNLYIKTWTSGGGWTAPANIGGTTKDQPAICSRADGVLDIFYRGSTGSMLWTRHWTTAGGWGAETCLGGNILSGVSACKRGANNIEVVARGAGSDVQHITWSSTTGWGSWESLGGTTYDVPCIISRSADHMEEFYRGTDNVMYHRWWFNTTGWSGNASLGGSITSGPTAVSRSSDTEEVFARGSSGDLQHIWYQGAVWSGWASLGGIVGRVGVCATDANTMHTFHRATYDRMFKKSYNGAAGWESGWTDLGLYF